MPISDGNSVTIAYVGRLPDGTVFDTSDEEYAEKIGLAAENPKRIFEPLTVEIGEEQVIPGLEEALYGLEEGDQTVVELPPEQAYGEYDENKVGEYDREKFEKKIGQQELTTGFEVKTQDGRPGRVVAIEDETVTIDFNHELAGERLQFEIEILDVK